jgi:ribosome-binding protein aMBF1 (putative translation factor)
MNKQKKQALEKAGYVLQDAEDFFELTPEERAMVELRIVVSRAVRENRERQKLTQQEVAKMIQSSQSRIAKVESASSDVTLDLMFRSFFAVGGRMNDLPMFRERRAKTGRVSVSG